jgi:hypothetical protein
VRALAHGEAGNWNASICCEFCHSEFLREQRLESRHIVKQHHLAAITPHNQNFCEPGRSPAKIISAQHTHPFQECLANSHRHETFPIFTQIQSMHLIRRLTSSVCLLIASQSAFAQEHHVGGKTAANIFEASQLQQLAQAACRGDVSAVRGAVQAGANSNGIRVQGKPLNCISRGTGPTRGDFRSGIAETPDQPTVDIRKLSGSLPAPGHAV